MMANALARAVLGVGADRMRNCIVSNFWEERNNGLKWAMSTSTHTQIRISHQHGNNQKTKTSLEMAWWPSYENFINKKIFVR